MAKLNLSISQKGNTYGQGAFLPESHEQDLEPEERKKLINKYE